MAACRLRADKERQDPRPVHRWDLFPPGSAGSRHGAYIAREAVAAVHQLSPSCLVLDVTNLDCAWGDTRLRVFQDVSQFMDADVLRGAPPFPVLVAVAERSAGIRSLLGTGSSAVLSSLDQAILGGIELGSAWQEW